MARAAETYRAARRNAWIRRDKRAWRDGRFGSGNPNQRGDWRPGIHLSLDSKLAAAAHGQRS